LKGQDGDSINFIMAAAGFNFNKVMKKLKAAISWMFLKLKMMFLYSINQYPKIFTP